MVKKKIKMRGHTNAWIKVTTNINPPRIVIIPQYMTFMASPWHKTPCPRDHETYNFSRLFITSLVIIKIFLVFWTMHKRAKWTKEDFHRNYAFSLYDLYVHVLAHKTPAAGGQELKQIRNTLPWSSLPYTYCLKYDWE